MSFEAPANSPPSETSSPALPPGRVDDAQPRESRDFNQLRRNFAVLKISVESTDWKPRNERSCPPGLLPGVESGVAAEFCRAFNASGQAASRRNVAVLLMCGGGLILTGANAAGRTSDPTAFPSNAETGLTSDEAVALAAARNADAFRLAKIPREWWICIQSIESALHVGAFQNAIYRKAAHRVASGLERPETSETRPQPAAGPSSFSESRVALVHPSYGTIAISPRALPEADVAVILAEARPAILRDLAALPAGGDL